MPLASEVPAQAGSCRDACTTRRALAIDLGLAVACVGLGLLALTLGTMPVSLADAARALAGDAAAPVQLVVLDWRLPRILAALCAGSALGMAGALFQTLLRNPLGSPDVIGFDAGAFSGAILAMLAGAAASIVALASFAGGLLAGLIVYAAAGGGHVERNRLILIGIAVGAGFTALNDWLIFTAPLDSALIAASWKQGALAGVDRSRLAIGAAILLVLLPLGLACRRTMAALALGDDKAMSLGEPAGPARLRLGLTGLCLTAAATLIAGPVGFVALIAPHAARRLVGSAGLPLSTSALFGALFLLGSDCVARLLFAPRSLPVGAVTACLGGLYFVLLLRSRLRRGAES
ncbi:FecCD family ABC transporter permease [Bosea sp. (in: a-proteobacteria)]|uniref:FecCD family ABC transporter permease n=1 Tax=Bosea sp. (in: a-proteobacteria) TaxID=1871050 RepID=UPI002DDD7DB1|nr:iron chelate uptake ABC transporter family permease subunit [Bosea sp. (in: a-proteobacteria)]HEV2508835.1 iron chelate uptake ABC transporter family permease subunit [Bosea sp. (in: a-proteobacteria)]